MSSESAHAEANSKWFDFIQVVITELTEPHLSPREPPPAPASSLRQASEAASSTEANGENESRRFYVEEPYDYIFEPEHYPRSSVNSGTVRQQSFAEGNNVADRNRDSSDAEDLSAIKNENKFTYAKMVGETNGFLEYEYQSYT